MSTTVHAPQQYKQPSRKGRKAWRKNVDISEIQEGLRLLKEDEIKGGVLAERPSEEIFMIDTTGSEEVRKKVQKSQKVLKADEILALRSAIPALDTHKRSNSKVTDGVVEPKAKRHKSDWVSKKEWLRLKQAARDGKFTPSNGSENELYDPWANSDDPSPLDDPHFDFLEKPKPKVEPDTLKIQPISLAANGKPVPSVSIPNAGISYNPVFEDWDRLLAEQGQKAVDAERKRLEEEEAARERKRLIEDAKDDDGEAKSDDESAWEGFESEYEKPEWLNKKRPERKTKAQRNRIKRRKEAERKAKWEEETKQKEEQVARYKELAEQLKEKEKEPQSKQRPSDDSSEAGDDAILRRRPLGRNLAPEKPLEIVLPDELQDSLRLLKPEGSLLADRYRTLIVQGKLESRKPVVQAKKAKRKLTEKWAYKDFQVPGLD